MSLVYRILACEKIKLDRFMKNTASIFGLECQTRRHHTKKNWVVQIPPKSNQLSVFDQRVNAYQEMGDVVWVLFNVWVADASLSMPAFTGYWDQSPTAPRVATAVSNFSTCVLNFKTFLMRLMREENNERHKLPTTLLHRHCKSATKDYKNYRSCVEQAFPINKETLQKVSFDFEEKSLFLLIVS